MPTYDYECAAGHVYERREPFGSPSEHDCEQCGKPAHRLLSAPPLIFKGSGWYATDSRSNSRNGSRKGGAEAAPSESSESAASTDGGSEPAAGEAAKDKSSATKSKSGATSEQTSSSGNDD